MSDICEKVLNDVLAKEIAKAAYRCINEISDIPVGVSNKHVHLSREHMDILFGKESELTIKKMLGQPGQYASEECVKIIGPKGLFNKVRVLGPIRGETQVEISKSDSFVLGIKAPVKESGVLDGTPGVILEGPCGSVELDKGVMVAMRHIHLTPPIAKILNLQDKQKVTVDVAGERGCVLKEVLVRVSEKYASEMHIDVDEANAVGLENGDMIRIG